MKIFKRLFSMIFLINFLVVSNILRSLLKVEMDFPDFFCLARKSFMPSTFEDQARNKGIFQKNLNRNLFSLTFDKEVKINVK